MTIQLNNIGKKYGKNWIFRHLDVEIQHGKCYAVIGNNGSGKSTLLQTIAGFLTPNEGEISYQDSTVEEIFKEISFCGPYIDLVEEMTLPEILAFHSSYKPLVSSIKDSEIIDMLGFDTSKFVKEYSSGMKQRLKLVLTLFSDVSLILLDEPTANLDEEGVKWYLSLIEQYREGRTLLVASNDKREYSFCEETIDIRNYK